MEGGHTTTRFAGATAKQPCAGSISRGGVSGPDAEPRSGKPAPATSVADPSPSASAARIGCIPTPTRFACGQSSNLPHRSCSSAVEPARPIVHGPYVARGRETRVLHDGRRFESYQLHQYRSQNTARTHRGVTQPPRRNTPPRVRPQEISQPMEPKAPESAVGTTKNVSDRPDRYRSTYKHVLAASQRTTNNRSTGALER